MHQLKTSFLLFALLFLAACGPTGPEEPVLPNLDEGMWNAFDGGGDTVCANGSDYSYFAYPGSSNKLVIDFQGGGACWDSVTCSSPYSDPNPALGGFYLDRVTASLSTSVGIYDRDNPDNPVQDWYHVFIPYCTGDLHIGNNTKAYMNPSTQETYGIEHKGSVNAEAALEWTFENFSAPESIFVTGCSAGAYGAAFWTERIAAQYPDAEIYQLGDCGAGVATDAWSAVLGESWNVEATLPETTFDADFVSETYIDTLAAADNLKMAQYNTLFDGTQIGFYAYATGRTDDPSVGSDWSTAMLASLEQIAEASDDFVSYTSTADPDGDPNDGTQHCVIGQENFYEVQSGGRLLHEWLDDYVNGRSTATVRASAN